MLTESMSIQHTGGEQARGLRALVARRSTAALVPSTRQRGCHTIAIAGGKGGVGRSVIALNLAITFAQRGERVGLVDACPDFGSIGLLCGLSGYWNLSHVLQGCRKLDEIVSVGPCGISVLSGASSLASPVRHPLHTWERTFDDLTSYERELDWLIIDASGGSSTLSREMTLAADDLLIVTTPVATAITEAYATVKSVMSAARPRLGLLVNQAESERQAQRILDRLQDTAHSLLHVDLHRRGSIPRDESIPASVNARSPFVLQAPASPAAQALRALVQRWTRPQAPDGNGGYFSRLRKREFRQ
jgi:flagellar biosynthesis protein FlhG